MSSMPKTALCTQEALGKYLLNSVSWSNDNISHVLSTYIVPGPGRMFLHTGVLSLAYY